MGNVVQEENQSKVEALERLNEMEIEGNQKEEVREYLEQEVNLLESQKMMKENEVLDLKEQLSKMEHAVKADQEKYSVQVNTLEERVITMQKDIEQVNGEKEEEIKKLKRKLEKIEVDVQKKEEELSTLLTEKEE